MLTEDDNCSCQTMEILVFFFFFCHRLLSKFDLRRLCKAVGATALPKMASWVSIYFLGSQWYYRCEVYECKPFVQLWQTQTLPLKRNGKGGGGECCCFLL